VVSGGTDNHLFLVSFIKQGLTGKAVEEALGKTGITVNKNAVPNDPQSPFVTSGMRIGTPAVTTRCFVESEVESLAHWMCDVIENMDDEKTISTISEKVRVLCRSFPVYSSVVDDDMTVKATMLTDEH
jgi:glycine hydroxymethyltransferase